ncbi:heme biosynthesis HemY N-terminal domain-containing protein [Bradyrhizobium sp. CIAT3101]|uniref:heme biosynthesis protein HemY n=1 Tax=Bradyrhizobium sp. CIAT3101 TaxID=439387 RepID=UPI0024B0F037|nr:heme biosynthesis HemY N-terminal domain-containing protein [Bradyrhizobium sp. CIAT3101]WFU81486.1 heme biosynthesis HemY N-terminal domain-containing protein [Bradyrhizobium sp. CIAT3101]
MLRIVFFLVLIALAGAGAAWVADQPGDVVLTWGGFRASPSIPVFVLCLGIFAVLIVLLWSIVTMIWRTPGRMRRRRHEKRHARGRHAITHGLLAIGHGDTALARRHADAARRHAPNDPLALLLHAQSAQLDGNRDEAQRAFRAMAEREDTRLLGLRGLFIEAQRADDAVGAVMIAEEAIKLSPSSTWASHAVLGFRCARGDWSGALAILDSNLSAGLIDKQGYRRQRGVLLTARALELETMDRDVARESVMEAVKLAPTLVPAAVLAAKFESEAHQVRRAMKLVEAAWLANPHPDLADAYAHVKLGDAARQRLQRVETLAAKTPADKAGHVEGQLAIARAAIDATEFARAREVLAPYVNDPTQRVALLMAELERTEHGDGGRARAWTLRAVRARHDPAWTADGYVSDRWRPVSPVTGRLDAFQWQTPVASLPSDKGTTIESSAFEEAMLAAPPPKRVTVVSEAPVEPAVIAEVQTPTPAPAPAPAAQDNAPPAATEEPVVAPAEPIKPAPEAAESSPVAATPVFRTRADLGKPTQAPIQAVIPIVRAPDDPGIDDDGPSDEFTEQIGTPRDHAKAQAGGWRGFWSRWGA